MADLPSSPVPSPDPCASPEAWEPAAFRDYLMVLARIQLDRRLDARLSPSDVVQQALMSAHAAKADLRAETPQERLAWLRRILANCIQKARRDLCRDKRDARRECSLEAAIERSSVQLAQCLAATGPSPSAGLRSEERLLQVASAILALPEAQRDAVILKYFQGLSQEEIAVALGRSSTAVAGLLYRGLKELGKRLEGC